MRAVQLAESVWAHNEGKGLPQTGQAGCLVSQTEPGLTFSPCGQTLKFAEDQVVLIL